MVKLIFYTDFNEDLKIYKKWKLRRFFGEKAFNYFLKEYYPEIVGKNDKEILDYFRTNRKKLINQLKLDKKQLGKKWKKVERDFFKQVGQITGFGWKHKLYKCHLSFSFICGGCYDARKGNQISIFPRISKKYLLDTLFHELVHLHYWDCLDRLQIGCSPTEKLKARGKFWDFSEIEVNYILQKIKIRGYKPEFNLYPQHKSLYKKIRKYWDLNFKEFMINSIKTFYKNDS